VEKAANLNGFRGKNGEIPAFFASPGCIFFANASNFPQFRRKRTDVSKSLSFLMNLARRGGTRWRKQQLQVNRLAAR
jgi:hypothetical protein